MPVHAQCWKNPADESLIFAWLDVASGERALFGFTNGTITPEPIDEPCDFADWVPCGQLTDRHELNLELFNVETVSVSAAQAISNAFDALDEIIIGPNQSTTVSTSVINIDGDYGILAQAYPLAIWDDRTTAHGVIEIDAADAIGLDDSVVLHELLHVMGFANIPGLPFADLVETDELGRPVFAGEHATEAWLAMGGTGHPPLYAPDGGSHWDEEALRNEIQTPFSDGADNVISALTLGALIDIGYKVNRAAADRFNLRDALTAERCENCSIARYT